jgi:hypothetical protein
MNESQQSRLQRSWAVLRLVATETALAKRETGKAITSQLAEILALRFGPGRLSPDEYFQYCLYDDRKYGWRQKTEFMGRRMENGLIPILKGRRWVGLPNDKLLSYAVFKGLGFRTPEIFAVYHSYRAFGAVPGLRSPAELAAFLRSSMRFPFVAKPVFGMFGREVRAVLSHDARTDTLTLTSGEQPSVDAFVAHYADGVRKGVLFQQLLRPHAAIRSWCGDRICSVRMVALVDRDGPRLVATVWKIATGRHMADNYWEPGNMIAAVEPATGLVGRPFTGLGRDIRHIDRHPDTDQLLTGITLPDWKEAVELCLTATASMPGIRMQAWDVALTDHGPVLLEVNVNGGMRLPQLVAGRGLYHGDFRDFLEQHRYPAKLSLARLVSGPK